MRIRQFTATRFVRALTPPSQPDSPRPTLAVLLYEDGFYGESTYDRDAPTFDPKMEARQFFAAQRGEKPAITVTDDLGTEYLESGGGGRMASGCPTQVSASPRHHLPPPASYASPPRGRP